MLTLKHPFVQVETDSGKSFGGSQMTNNNAVVRKYGCGVVAAFDTLLYLSRWHCPVNDFSEIRTDAPISVELYNTYIDRLRKSYFPILPSSGKTGIGIMAGMNLFFRTHHLPFSAVWCFRSDKLWGRMEEMLKNDIPAILSVGPNFPCTWHNHRAALYSLGADGSYIRTASVKAHYITVVGMDETWVNLSSWGKKYYLNRREFEQYVSDFSAGFVSNLLYIIKK